MTAHSYDQTADKHGGWAHLCDPRVRLSDSIYEDFQSAGLRKPDLDEIRNTESMAARNRVLLDVAEDLVRTWSRYLCGFITGAPSVELDRFIDLPLTEFWAVHRQRLQDYSVSRDEIEALIQTTMEHALKGESPYVTGRMKTISNLARLCRAYPPPDDGPDLNPALVPLGPIPPSSEASEALRLPEPDQENDQS